MYFVTFVRLRLTLTEKSVLTLGNITATELCVNRIPRERIKIERNETEKEAQHDKSYLICRFLNQHILFYIRRVIFSEIFMFDA